MRIDERVEPLVREILTGVVKRDEDRFIRGLEALPDDTAAAKALELAVAVTSFVMAEQYGRVPNLNEIQRVAAAVADAESWSGLTEAQLAEALTAMVETRSANLEPQAVVAAPFVLAGYALSVGAEDNEWWFNYLDRVEAKLERLPER
jgi:hypothetical protein